MIKQLVDLANQAGTAAAPAVHHITGITLDLMTGEIREDQSFTTVLPLRSSDIKPGLLCETVKNLARDSPFRKAMIQLAEEWAGLTPHPLPGKVAQWLQSEWEPSGEPTAWLCFVWGGETPQQLFPDLIKRTAAPEMLEPHVCLGCGELRPIVSMHDGLPAISRMAPRLTTWNRGELTAHGRLGLKDGRGGEALPTCLECMWKYVAYLNGRIRRRSGEMVADIDGQEWVIESTNRAGFVLMIRRPDDPAKLWEMMKRINRMDSIKAKSAPGEVDMHPPQTKEPAYWVGYMYAMLEWIAWCTRDDHFPSLEETAAAPAQVLGAWLVRLHGQTAKYLPPSKGEKGAKKTASAKARPASDEAPESSTREKVRALYQDTVKFVTGRLDGGLPERLLPQEYGWYALGYGHGLGKWGPRRAWERAEMSGGPTPWEMELIGALQAIGLEPVSQHPVDRGAGLAPYRLDIAFPSVMYCVEVDGRLHGLFVRDHKGDAERSLFLGAQGWTVQRVPNKLVRQRPEYVAEMIAQALTLRGLRWERPTPSKE